MSYQLYLIYPFVIKVSINAFNSIDLSVVLQNYVLLWHIDDLLSLLDHDSYIVHPYTLYDSLHTLSIDIATVPHYHLYNSP
jgi:hypothetical protein